MNNLFTFVLTISNLFPRGAPVHEAVGVIVDWLSELSTIEHNYIGHVKNHLLTMKQFTLNNEIERASFEENQCRPEIKFILCVQATSDFDLVDARFKTFGQSSCYEDV